MSKLIILCLLGLTWSTFCTVIRGLQPKVKGLYESDPFFCLDGSSSIPLSAINDDYCDCTDGSDEPGTSACPTGTFYCANGGLLPQTIFSSRVNDGICDCCDGSDEYLSTKCTDTCQAAWEESTKQIRQDIKDHETGINFVKQKREEYILLLQQKKVEALEKQMTKDALQPVLDDLGAKKAEEQRQVEELTNKLKEELKDEIEALVSSEFEEQQRVKAENEQRRREEEGSRERTEDEQQRLERSRRRYEEHRVHREHHEEHDHDHDHDHHDHDHDHDHDEHVPTYKTPELTPEDKQKEEAEEAERQKQAIRNRVTEQKLEENEKLKALKESLRILADEYNNKNNQMNDANRDIETINKFLQFDYGPDAIFSYLKDQTTEYQTPEYTYTLQLFESVTQGHTRVGNWKEFRNNYSEMLYDNGERCWGGPDRSMVVRLVCGAENKILEVKEPAKCEYEMTMKTPGACTEKALAELKKLIQ